MHVQRSRDNYSRKPREVREERAVRKWSTNVKQGKVLEGIVNFVKNFRLVIRKGKVI